MADGQVDISGMPPPPQEAQGDPTADMPTPEQMYREYWAHNPAVDTTNIPKDKLDDFMANPPPRRVPASEQLSALTGVPKVLAEANPITPRIAGWAGRAGALTGAVGASLDPDHASEDLAEGNRRANDWSANVYKFFGYLPGKLATKEGNEMAERALAAPGQAIGAAAGAAGSVADILSSDVDIAYDDQGNPIAGPGGVTHRLSPSTQENISATAKDVAGTVASTLGVPDVRGTARAIQNVTTAARTALVERGLATPTEAETAAGIGPKKKGAAPDASAPTPPVGEPVTAETLRAQPNPIPPPDGTVAAARAKVKVPPRRATVNPAPEPPTAPVEPTAATPAQPTAPPTATQGAPNTSAERGSVRLFHDDDSGSRVPLFIPPTKEGPQENPTATPAQVQERAGHLNDLDKLSGGMLPSRRTSALTGDYNATGDDFQTKEIEPAGGPMKTQIASENAALHAATDTVHQSLGSNFSDSVDPQTVSNRGRVIRNAVNAIEQHFDDATDGFYQTARALNQGRPIAKLQRVSDYLNDDSNFTNDAEIGLQRAAKQRLQRLWTTGDPDGGAPPGSVNAAERFREFLNNKGKNPNAMGVAGELKGHLDMDVAEHGGPGLFKAARAMRQHSFQMLEEPTGIKKLLAPSDSQGINHAIPTEKVADYVADLPREQHEHVLNVLRAGAHLSPEIAEKSAAAMREIQAHVVSRIHDAATNKADGSWNASKFYNAAADYGPKLPSLFKERPDVLGNLQTVSRAGNTLKMDKHYPGAGAQVARTGMVQHAVEGLGALASGIAHELPLGRIVGRGIEAGTEKLTGKMGEQGRNKATMSRLVDRTGKQRGSVQVMRGDDTPASRMKDEFDRTNPAEAPVGYLGKRVGKSTAELYTDPGDDRTVHLEKLAADQPGSGHGTAALKQITDLADKHGARVTLDAVPQGTSPIPADRLKAYYARHGFTPDGRTENSMTREPQGGGGATLNSKQRGSVRVLPQEDEEQMHFDHYSNLNTPTATLDPKFYGTGLKGAEARRGGTKTIALYPVGAKPELGLEGKTKYRVSVPASRMYDMSNDPEGLRANAPSYSDAEDAVKDAGYAGYHTPEHANPLFRGQGRLLEPTTATRADVMQSPGGKQRGSVRVMDEAPRTEEEGSQINVGLHQGQKGQPGFRKMSKQEAQAAVESTGAKVTKTSVLTPEKHGVFEPTAVMSTDRPLSDHEMQSVLAKTKQSAIPQRTGQGDESMHVAPGHEEIAKKEGWSSFNPDYFREHDGRTMTEHGANPSAPNPYPPHPDATVKNPKQSAFPGIYDDPKDIVARLPKTPESPHLKDIFGVTRKDLHDATIARGDVEPKTPIPGITQKGAGSAHAQQVKTPENAERIRNVIQAYKDHDLSGYHGMVGWYEMDPMYLSIKKILGGDAARANDVYHRLNSYTAYASPMSPVGTEIRRGTAAATMAAEGNFDKFVKQGGKPQDKLPASSPLKAKNFELGNEGTMAHGSQAPAMARFNERGQEANAVKTGTYRRSSDAPSREGNEHQNTAPVGDSHWSRGVGLADVRGAKAFEGSAEGSEMKVLGKWYHDEIARHPDVDIPSTSAQAVQWGALSKETGVESPVGSPKLEIWADQIAAAAKRAGIEPKEMWVRIIKRLAK